MRIANKFLAYSPIFGEGEINNTKDPGVMIGGAHQSQCGSWISNNFPSSWAHPLPAQRGGKEASLKFETQV
ncbi:MAG: hypothetical protein RBQ87_06790 [Candidatus Cloacimonadaceae bacterium]|nr:hypothetical protein [Candidatus Cloacimonadota bacterium]MDY0325864.1 hypothetical protein [Candidatus Cloacimonadaceae bacterium]